MTAPASSSSSFIESHMRIASPTSCIRSLSRVTRTAVSPAAAVRVARVARQSSPSTPAIDTRGIPSASTRRWMYGICTTSSSAIGGRWAL
ncbi:MAG: hypothetical protein COW73_06020 [Nitrospirae bacterium CG18_big_fil_WC_8_21_14_2_50_70_55]|nr:MAG: hypothetical protein COW73_06020 [Nitrospirae bacterium CG18_big_fil_WC_8_21_14_2_50_70_55]